MLSSIISSVKPRTVSHALNSFASSLSKQPINRTFQQRAFSSTPFTTQPEHQHSKHCTHGSTTSATNPTIAAAIRRLSQMPSQTQPTSPATSPRAGTSSFQSPSPSSYTVLHPSNNAPETLAANSELAHLFENNKQWADSMAAQYPGFFDKLSKQQKPKFMWIGCSDSRVPASELLGLMPGEVFVHRNIANQCIHADLNMLSCLQLAVDVLKVEHVIVCGHYSCGGVNFALKPTQVGICDNWIRHIKDVARANADVLSKCTTFEEQSATLSERNVVAQVENVCHTSIVQNAWRRGQPLTVHGWIYGVHDGVLRNLVEPAIKGFEQVSPAFHIDPPQAP